MLMEMGVERWGWGGERDVDGDVTGMGMGIDR